MLCRPLESGARLVFACAGSVRNSSSLICAPSGMPPSYPPFSVRLATASVIAAVLMPLLATLGTIVYTVAPPADQVAEQIPAQRPADAADRGSRDAALPRLRVGGAGAGGDECCETDEEKGLAHGILLLLNPSERCGGHKGSANHAALL